MISKPSQSTHNFSPWIDFEPFSKIINIYLSCSPVLECWVMLTSKARSETSISKMLREVTSLVRFGLVLSTFLITSILMRRNIGEIWCSFSMIRSPSRVFGLIWMRSPICVMDFVIFLQGRQWWITRKISHILREEEILRNRPFLWTRRIMERSSKPTCILSLEWCTCTIPFNLWPKSEDHFSYQGVQPLAQTGTVFIGLVTTMLILLSSKILLWVISCLACGEFKWSVVIFVDLVAIQLWRFVRGFFRLAHFIHLLGIIISLMLSTNSLMHLALFCLNQVKRIWN